MKLFLDTNIFLDILFEREACIYAKQIIRAIQNGTYEGYVADITLLNIDYIAKKQVQDMRKFLSFIERNFIITGADNSDMRKAIALDNLDLEDNVQNILAKKSACDFVISNDQAFIQNGLVVLGAKLFIARYLR